MAEELKKPNGLDTDHVEDLQTDRTGVGEVTGEQELSRKAPPPVSNWNFPLLFSISAVVFTAGGLVTTFTLKTASQPQDHEEVIKMKVEVEMANKKLDALDEYLRDIREDMAAHGLLNKTQGDKTNANPRKR